ncbi:MAG: hypothetical protein E7589_05780 [Ruminococcaceae bacterium]|nr:hypothetical protein [Oscillospiraceae bacterium]
MATEKRPQYTDVDISASELCRMSVEELEEFYGTNASAGLTHREASTRRSRRTGGRLFSIHGKSASVCMGEMFSYPLLWLLLAIALVAILFERAFLGAAVAFVAVAEGIVLGLLERKAQTFDMELQRKDAPMPRVLRSGKLYRVREEELVVGDIVILFEGDIAAADARLLSAAELEVEEYLTGERVMLSKRAEPTGDDIPKGQMNSPDNMVYAGDVVRSGYGVAVVTAVGLDTHAGAKDGGIRPLHLPAHLSRDSAAVRSVNGFFSVYSLVSAVSIIPLLIVSILTLSSKSDLFGIILSCVALATASMGVQAIALVRVSHTVCRTGLYRLGESGTSSIVKTRACVDTLGKITDIIAIGTSAVHDGIPHPEQIMIDGERYVLSEGDNDTRLSDFAEKLHLAAHNCRRFNTYMSASEIRLLSELTCAWGEPELESLSLRLDSTVPLDIGVHVAYKSGEEGTLRLSDNFSEIRRSLPEGELKSNYINFVNQVSREGLGVLFLLGGDGNELKGAVAYARHTSKRTGGAVRSLEDRGVRVFMFEHSESFEAQRVLRECGFDQNAPLLCASRREECILALNTDDKIFNSIKDFADCGVRAFAGVDRDEIHNFILELKRDGRRVTVIAHELDDLGLMSCADVAVACSPECYERRTKVGMPQRPALAGGSPDSHPNGGRACDLMLRRADIIIGRATETGGGFLSLARAYGSARRCDRKLTASIKYLVSAMAARAVLVAVPMIFGLSLMSGIGILLSGMAFDAMAMLSLALAGDSTEYTEATGKNTSLCKHDVQGILLLCKDNLLCVGIAFVSYVLTLLIVFSFGFGALDELFGSALAALLAVQLAVYAMLVKWRGRGEHGGRTTVSRASAILTLLMLALTVVAAVAAIVSGTPPASLLPTVAAPLAYAVALRLIRKRRKTEK